MKLRRNAFTLVELLVVIGIIGLLSGILLPSLCKAKARVRATACKSNLRQISLALTMYVGDFHKYPSDTEWAGNALRWDGGKLLSYVGKCREVFVCPSRKPFVAWAQQDDTFDRFGYGYNSFGSGRWESPILGMGYRPLSYIGESQIKQPADMIAVGDVGVGSVSDWLLNPNEELLAYDETLPSNSWLPANRHSGGAKILFCDGHVEYAAQKRWIEKTDPSRRRWNHDHEPHPETW